MRIKNHIYCRSPWHGAHQRAQVTFINHQYLTFRCRISKQKTSLNAGPYFAVLFENGLFLEYNKNV